MCTLLDTVLGALKMKMNTKRSLFSERSDFSKGGQTENTELSYIMKCVTTEVT